MLALFAPTVEWLAEAAGKGAPPPQRR